MILAIIPARSGSKGLPNKNIKSFLGKPLIAYTILEALKVPEITKVMVNTDSEAIASIAKEYGASTPFLRPPELAQDETPMIKVITHTLSWFEEHETPVRTVILLQPTSPLRTHHHIQQALALFQATRDEQPDTTVVSVTPVKHHPYWAFTIKHHVLTPFLENMPLTPRRQDLPPAYALNGAIYIASSKTLKTYSSFITPYTRPFIMDPYESIDIDTKQDFDIAETLFKKKHFFNNRFTS